MPLHVSTGTDTECSNDDLVDKGLHTARQVKLRVSAAILGTLTEILKSEFSGARDDIPAGATNATEGGRAW